MCNTSKGCTLQARKPAEQQNWQSATVSESGQGSGHSLVVGHKTTWNHPNSVYPRVGSPLELPDQKSFMHSPWHACFIRCFRSSSKWRNGNLFSSKVLPTTAGTLLTSSPSCCCLVMMIIPGGSSADSLHRMNVTAGYKGVVGRTCKTDPNRCAPRRRHPHARLKIIAHDVTLMVVLI